MTTERTYLLLYREANFIAKGNEDLRSELYLKGLEALSRFDPKRGIKLKTYLSAVLEREARSLKRRAILDAKRVSLAEDLSLELAPPRETPVSTEFELEETRLLLGYVLRNLPETEREIVLALLKSGGQTEAARRRLASAGVFYHRNYFASDVLPAVKAMVKELIKA